VGDIILDRMMYEEFDNSDFHFEAGERIEGVLEDGQELIVQVSREPIGQKGTRVTSKITLPDGSSSSARHGPYRCLPEDRG
jgi:ribonuclease G